MTDQLYGNEELARLLGVTTRTLRNWRCLGLGPPFVREGRWIRYRSADVDAWLAAKQQTQEVFREWP